MNTRDPRIYLMLAFALNLLQAILMPITEDEAYYWKYAQRMDWGYFDHPPMVALMIWIGNLLFKGTLGVRLLANIAWVFTVISIWLMIPADDRKKDNSVLVFVLLILGMPLLNLYGFVTTPDTPLLLFSAVYLLLFKQYIELSKVKHAILLGVVAALLMYSKYHGILVIGFSFLAYPRQILKRNFYIFAFTGIVCFLPHLWWQYQHDFMSIKYHLLYRTENELRLSNIMNYITNTLLVLNPLFVGMYIIVLIRHKDNYKFPFHFHVLVWGAFVFFGLSALRDHVEPHWIAFAVIPLTVMVHKIVIIQKQWFKIFKIGAVIIIFLLLAVRAVLILPGDLNPLPSDEKIYYSEIQQLAGEERVAFINSYHGAAKYSFYTGDDAFSYNCLPYGKKQYDFWPYEKTYQAADVFLIGGWPSGYLDTLLMESGDMLFYKHVKNFQVLSRVDCEVIDIPDPVVSGKKQNFQLRIDNPYIYPLEFKKGEMALTVELFFFSGRSYIHFLAGTTDIDQVPPQSSIIVNGTFNYDFEPGNYQLAIGLRPGDLTAVPVGPRVDVEIKR